MQSKKPEKKAKMVLYLRADQGLALRALAKKEDKPISRLVREAIDLVLKHYRGTKK